MRLFIVEGLPLYRRSSITSAAPWVFVGVGGPPRGVEALAQALVERGQQVPVTVEGELDGRVAETLLDLLGMRSLGDEQRGAGVPKIVEPKSRR